MANPQKENGYTAISNELYEAMICFRIPGECEQVLKAIIRKTYGYNKAEDRIAISQICELTKLKKQNVSRALKKLVEHKVVIKSDDHQLIGHKLSINKDYEEWQPMVIKSDDPKKGNQKRLQVSSKLITPVIKSDDKTSSEVMTTKDKTISKVDIQKKGDAPAILTKYFFTGVTDLKEKQPSNEGSATQAFLRTLEEKYPQAGKGKIWQEIQKFHSYWTESNHSGTKQRWQLEKTFQVDRRLSTWLGRVKDFQANDKPKGKQIE